MWDPPLVSDFDAELYLRLIGEQMLLDRGDQERGSRRPPIAEAAGALVAVGVITAPRAEAVLDDYSLAAALRNDPHFRRRTMMGARPAQSEGKPLPPRRIVPCERTVEQPNATVHVRWVSLSEDGASVAVRWRPDPAQPWSSAGPPQAMLTDDRGTTETAFFVGGGSSEGMLGSLKTMRPLATDTAWVELDGTRLELTGEATPFETAVERLPEQPPAHRYLWQRIAEPHEFSRHSVEPAIDALVAAGVLSADDPLLGDLREVLEAMPPRGPGPTSGAARRIDRMPEPWRSLVGRQGRHDGPTGSIALGAVTPPFDGFSVAVVALTSERDAFQAEVEVAPGVSHRMPFEWNLQTRQLAWWARDDRGNHYLGHTSNWDSSGDFGHGLIAFRPALDPRATKLAIMPTAETMRAVVSFDLRWTHERTGASG